MRSGKFKGKSADKIPGFVFSGKNDTRIIFFNPVFYGQKTELQKKKLIENQAELGLPHLSRIFWKMDIFNGVPETAETIS